MSNQIIPFEFKGNDVRIVTINDEPWFVLADLAKVLGIVDAQRLNSRLEDGVRQTHPISDRLGRSQNATIVSEAGMWEVVIRSDKPEAVAFRRWITGTVLPEIRKTGSYGMPSLPQGPELLAHAVLAANQMIAEKDATIAELTPKAEYVDTFVADNDVRLLRFVAQKVGVTESQLRADLIERGWIYKETQRRRNSKGEIVDENRYSAYAHKAPYFDPVPNHQAPLFKGNLMHTLKVTPQGAIAIARLYGKHLALVEAVAS